MLRTNKSKANDILGRRPSDEKVQKLLDISEEDLEFVEEENRFRLEEELEIQRQKHKIPIRTETKKAIELLGQNLSDDKIKQILGLDNIALAQAKEESAALIEETFEKIREKERVQNPRKKALDILGFPKEKKAKEVLGLNDEEFSESMRNRQERQEEFFENIRQSEDAAVISRMIESTKFISTGSVAKAKKILGLSRRDSNESGVSIQHQSNNNNNGQLSILDSFPLLLIMLFFAAALVLSFQSSS